MMNADTKKLCDMLENMNLRNHVWIPTHEMGHALDLLSTRENDNINIQQLEVRSYISDHAFVRARSVITKPDCETKNITFRKIKKIDITKFKADIRESGLTSMDN